MVLEGLIQTRYTREKLPRLYDLKLQVEFLRHRTRLLLEFEPISAKRYAYVGEQINGVGVELGGWIKQQRQLAQA